MEVASLNIALASPSSTFEPELLAKAQGQASLFKINIVGQTRLRKGSPIFLNGTKAERLRELAEAETFEADAIWCTRGGCGAIELLHDYRRELYAHKGAPLIGYSDTSILHFLRYYHAQRIGIHGPIFLDLRDPERAQITAIRLLVEGKAHQISYPPLRKRNHFLPTQIQGELIVMNLVSLQSLVGSFEHGFLRGKILGLEDINEPHYKVFRALQQLKNAGILVGLKALLVGHMTENREQIIQETFVPLAEDLAIPLFDWPIFGHDQPNWPLLFGAKSTIRKVDNDLYTLVYDEQHNHSPAVREH